MTGLTQRQLRIGLVCLMLLHLAILGLFYFDIIPGGHRPGTFLFHSGGDDNEYFLLAQGLVRGQFVRSQFTLGYPLLLIPWLVVFRPENSAALVPYVALFHSLLLFPLTQVILAGLALRITRQRSLALLTVLTWTLLPLVVYGLVALTGHAEVGAIWAVHLPWPQMLSDPPAAFLTLISFRLMFHIIDSNRDRDTNAPNMARQTLVWVTLLGVLSGLLLLIRLNSVLSLVAILAALAMTRYWWAALIVTVISGLFTVPQFVYNTVVFGSPFAIGYKVLQETLPDGLFNPVYVMRALTGKYALAGWLIMLVLTVLCSGGLYAVWRKCREGYTVVAVGIWVVAYLLFFAVYYYSWDGGITRFLIPAYPAMSLMIVCLAEWVWVRLVTSRKQARSQPPMIGPRPIQPGASGLRQSIITGRITQCLQTFDVKTHGRDNGVSHARSKYRWNWTNGCG